MEWTSLNELREKYLNFFESKGHMRLQSFSLVPQDDKSLLLINSGMAPMKKYFTGEVTPPSRRVTTCQKCIRTPDIERVGITARHGTFFEMLGNFSFGDYFKHEVTAWAWEFCTKVLELPVEKIYVSIYQDDDEAFKIWTDEVGVAPERIVRLGKEDNFWEHGLGPCGPCSELYFDRGESYGCGSKDCKVGCDCDRYVEFWNLVFTQFEKTEEGEYLPLEHPNIDTGMGLERLACIMQGVDNLFLVDTVQNIMDHIAKIANVKYGENPKTDVSLRVITDHIRSTTFMISDGVLPSNEGRGYVLRRLLRRAARHGKLLGIKGTFLSKVCETVISENKTAYPMLLEKTDFIKKIIDVEEKSFSKTIDQGLQILNNMIELCDGKTLSGEDAFKLSDTYGFPIDLTKEIVEEKNITVDEEKFQELMSLQKERARNARKGNDLEAWKTSSTGLNGFQRTEFVGYDRMKSEAKVIGIISQGDSVQYAGEGEVILILDKTPFYAESGGQVGDNGVISSNDAEVIVHDTTKDRSGIFFHKCSVTRGVISCQDIVSAAVNEKRRSLIMRNHTAAHLLQAALRKVLGNHVEQAGQFVNERQVRFDFTHFSSLSTEEINQVEKIVNEKIFEAIEVKVREMPISEAKKLGAMALFGEKYGDVVRVVSAADFSIELCGGTHTENTSKLGLFKIISESSVASGVRRIEAVTSEGAIDLLNNSLRIISECSSILKLNNKNDLSNSVRQTLSELKEKEKAVECLNSKVASREVDSLFETTFKHNDLDIITAVLKDTESKQLRLLCDKIKNRSDEVVAVIAGVCNGKANIAVVVGKRALNRGANAGKIAKAVAQLTGGNGGGRADYAMAGVKDISKLDGAIKASRDVIFSMVGDN